MGISIVTITLFANLVSRGEARLGKEYLQELDFQDGNRLLEVFIVTGANLFFLPVKATCFGLGISWGMLKYCQEKLRQWQVLVWLILCNAEELPLLDESFDSVLHGGIIAFNDREENILEINRVAMAGARIMIVDESIKMMESITWMSPIRNCSREIREVSRFPLDWIQKK